MKETFLLGLAIIFAAIIISMWLPKYQFYDVELSNNAYIQLRGNMLTGTLEQVTIE